MGSNGSLGWPFGNSDMAERIRAHDWAATPLGPIESWPQCLRSVVGLLVPSGFAMVALWGAELIQIYNDIYRDLMGAKHPRGLGQPAAECWWEIRHITEPVYRRVWAGETVTLQDALYQVGRDGSLEDAWFTLSYSPLHDETGAIAGILLTIAEATRQHRAEGALRQNEEQLAAIFANAAVGLSELAQDGRFLRANDELCRILGRTREEVLRLTAFDVTHPDDVPLSLAAIAEARRTNQPASMDKRYLRPDGSFVWANSRVQRLDHGEGQPSTQLAVTADLTDRRAAEERMRESEARLQLALDASRMGIWTYDPVADRFEFDERAAAIGGVEPIGALPALSVMALFHPDDVGLVQARLTEALDPHGSGWNEAEVRFVHSDNSVRWAHARAHAIFDGDGQSRWNIRLLGTLLDITERKQAEVALRESEAGFRAVANLVPGFLWSSDLEGRATWFSGRWFQYTGQSEDEALGDGWLEVVHPEDRQATIASFLQVVKEGRQSSQEYRLRGQDGTYRWFMVRAEPIRDASGQFVQCYGAVTDIHETHELQQRQAVMVDELQHRTRNLLTVVRAIAQQTMAQTGPSALFREQFNDRIAALSRVQGLLSRSDQEPITIRALVQTELDALGAATMRERVALQGPRVVLRKASVQTLALALHELATNARKYGALASEQGVLRVSWDTYTAEAGEQRLSLTWLEEGISTPEEGSPIRRGYGRELIEKALPYALKARTSYELGGTELRCSIDLPLTELAGARGP